MTPVQVLIPQYQYAAGYTIADYYGILPPEPETLSTATSSSCHATVASQCIHIFILAELRNARFKTYESAALDQLEKEVLHRHAKEYANLANRVLPTPFDVLTVCDDRGIFMISVSPARLVTPPLRELFPELLPSDDEDTPLPSPAQAAALPQALQDLPEHLPSLPPKAYLSSHSLQRSLRNLVKATEDTTGRGNLELASGVVSWMATSNTGKKRWKLR
ncbi:hypothetical protein M422DRAFT_22707 [Sphaerobolus stellatus SS14]|nr:hypothetical protein M422DRAFT_22707 [Sphaerobolus stellatus SS14]